ncbi:hypothetical protein FAM21834_00390 [Lentilactobacillus parabuchneri]|jgi:hypothetical protein|uniref:Uncharacterized protein n=2 Tax=Lentilactobacillus parabuchneri TaxID=152331 RepID=A0A1X1FH52_9LACO|nr:hypothetical protein [Lentilactobacillus parabuchneri]APR06658.1 hypothetical protein FAM21731_00444 [Lentilactobacillus parabuchneri]KRM45028.1 hypothetical protein FC51_GL001275 [Lentilactobacillus parabuchneri DSM 5707 = NBRC 107865]KRN75869.1 hypothetical protein IV42_GL000345 [Lentilactobacillus parabuchneri]MBW0223690.1 hypothetical protein [Lentilactobacillus parabuchneri]MBW0246757.1 hypothetical protein [Lentilactobacillus parabuchneri]
MQNPFGNGNNDDNNQNDPNTPGNLPIPPNFATVVNKENGQIRIAKVGPSFTALFFNLWVPIFRSDWYNLLCMAGVEIIAGMALSLGMGEPFQVAYSVGSYGLGIVWMLIYNMMYFKHLFNLGFVPADEHSKEILTDARYWKEPTDKNDA